VASILIIDDNEAFREMLGQMLVTMGHAVVLAPDGFEGTQLYRANPTELILTDLVMPHSGLGAIRVLRNEFPKLKVIAMSGGSRLLGYAKDVGAFRTLMKPFTPEQLTAAIAETLAFEPPAAPPKGAKH
jgi:CheY-like chemotaxis protein